MSLIAVDIGATGAFCFMEGQRDPEFLRMPLVAKYGPKGANYVDFTAVQTFIRTRRPLNVVVELPQARSSNAGNTTMVANFGIIVAAVQSLNIGIEYIHPVTWTAWLKNNTTFVNYKEQNKPSIPWLVSKGVNLPLLGPSGTGKKLHDGCADAYCIAYYWLNKT